MPVAFPPTAHAQEPIGALKEIGWITIGHRESSIPFSYLHDKHQPIGYAMELCMKAAIDRPGAEIEFAHAQVHELRGAQQCGHFVASEVVAQAWFVGHANNSPRTPSPSSPAENRARDARRTRMGIWN